MAFDQRNLQVFANFCGAAADAMAYTLMRTAHSAFVKETEDFSCQILTPEGLTFASPHRFGAPWYSGIDYGGLLATIETYEDGDVCITNDPAAGHVSTHTPDIHIWKPVFHEGRLVCFVVGHIHNTDVGGAVPASLSRALTEIVQEGLRIPPVKVVEKGVVDDYILTLIRANVRSPDQNIGDLSAQLASVAVGERKVLEIIRRFGCDAFMEGMRQLLDYAEAQSRAVIAGIPDGTYVFADYADEDSVGGRPCRIKMTLTIAGDEVVLDYTGSDPQLGSSLNMPTGGRERHSLAMVGFTYVLYTLSPGILLNSGTLRPARAILPEGTVVNAGPTAAVGMRSLTCALTQIVTIGAFGLALPERLPAASPGGNSIMNLKTTARNGRPIMASIGPVGAGGGGSPFADGSDAAGGITGFLRNTPLEISEAEVPIRFTRYGLTCDSGGPGLYRGGLSAMMEFVVSTPETVITARNRNRSLMPAWGMRGGRAGALSRFTRNPGTAQVMELANIDLVRCDPGDVVRVIAPGAGGWGDPFERPIETVVTDVRRGAVSEARAAVDYGVAIVDGRLDEAATAALRAAPRPPIEHFGFGAERIAYEKIWTSARYDELTAFLAAMPLGWRFYLKHRIFEAVEAAGAAGAEAIALQPIFEGLRTRFAL